MRAVCFAMTMVALAGCGTPSPMVLPVQGQVQGSMETFSGTATGYANGNGYLDVVTSTGVSCSGNFLYTNRRHGRGVFRCSDGRSGPFRFVSSGTRGLGEGSLGTQIFTFTFG